MLCNSIMLRQGSLEGVCRLDGAPGALRTPDLLIRNLPHFLRKILEPTISNQLTKLHNIFPDWEVMFFSKLSINFVLFE